MDAELETGFGEQKLKWTIPEQIRGWYVLEDDFSSRVSSVDRGTLRLGGLVNYRSGMLRIFMYGWISEFLAGWIMTLNISLF